MRGPPGDGAAHPGHMGQAPKAHRLVGYKSGGLQPTNRWTLGVCPIRPRWVVPSPGGPRTNRVGWANVVGLSNLHINHRLNQPHLLLLHIRLLNTITEVPIPNRNPIGRKRLRFARAWAHLIQ